jgi:hypothetical protein
VRLDFPAFIFLQTTPGIAHTEPLLYVIFTWIHERHVGATAHTIGYMITKILEDTDLMKTDNEQIVQLVAALLRVI